MLKLLCMFLALLLVPSSAFIKSFRAARSQTQLAFSDLSPLEDDVDTRSSLPSSQKEDDVRKMMQLKREVSILDDVREGASTLDAGTIDVDEELLSRLLNKRSYFSILTERLMQTIDDIQLSNKIKETSEYANRNYNAWSSSSGTKSKKERIVVLGTGWGAHSFIKTIDATMYDVTIISPRNYFLFTPMLAASAVGTVEFRSICEPIRNVNPLVNYLEASATSLDHKNKKVLCSSIKCVGSSCEMTDFEVEYDHVLVAVGATTNTFGIKGVRENCLFLKQVEDASNLRKALAYCFERANIPSLAEEEKRSALAFVVVGAGPTGVEFTSELRDWLESEGRRYYGNLLKYVSLTVVEAGKAVLAVFDETLQKEALVRLTERETTLIRDGYIEKEMTQVLLQAGVKEVGEKYIELSSGQKLPYGFCVWAAGNGPIPLVLGLIETLEEQKAAQGKARGRVAIDGWLRVEGAENVFSIGDCTYVNNAPLPATAQVASQQGAYLGRLFSKSFNMRQQAPLPPFRALGKENTKEPSQQVGFGRLGVASVSSSNDQVSSQNGNFEFAKPFQFLNLGVLAYIGASQALAQVSVDEKNILGSGPIGFLLWRGIYWSKQVSWRNRVLVGLDWVKGRLFGRDIGSL